MTLADRIIPPEALRWGPLTREPYAWHEDSLRYVWHVTRRLIAEPLMPLIERLCDHVVEMLEAGLMEDRS